MANKKCMKCYNAYKPSKYIAYLDANNLHGWAMSQYLPYSECKWLNQKEIVKFGVSLIGENCSNGYILEVDIEYPDELHKLHNNYPLAPKSHEIIHDMLPNYCSSTTNKYDIQNSYR